MARNGSGSYIPPAGNPVATGTVIQATWANSTITDIGNEITNSLPRDGQAPMSAPLKLTDGSASNPSLTFNSESSTGFYRPGASNLAAAISGTEALRLTSTGLGVGATPAAKVHAKGTGELLRLETTTARGGGSDYVAFWDPTGRKGYVGYGGGADEVLYINNEQNASIRLYTNASMRVEVDNSGQVGIGASPTAGYKLDVTGKTSVRVTAGADAYTEYSGNNNTPGSSSFAVGQNAANDAVLINRAGAGNLIFGAASTELFRCTPSGHLDPITDGAQNIGQSRHWGTLSALQVQRGSAGVLTISSSNASGTMDLRTAGASRIFIDSSGQVGIGGTPSSAKLHVFGSIKIDTQDLISINSGHEARLGYNAYTTTGGWNLFTNDSTSLNFGTTSNLRMSITSGGVIQDAAGIELGFKPIPRQATSGGTAAYSDRGKCYASTGGITVPASTFNAGDALSIYNDSASAITITQGSTLTLRWAGTTNTGNRTLAARGFCTVWFNSATEAIVSGAGIT